MLTGCSMGVCLAVEDDEEAFVLLEYKWDFPFKGGKDTGASLSWHCVCAWWAWSVCLGTKMSCVLTRQTPGQNFSLCFQLMNWWRAEQRCPGELSWQGLSCPLIPNTRICSESTILGEEELQAGGNILQDTFSSRDLPSFCSDFGLLCQTARVCLQVEP